MRNTIFIVLVGLLLILAGCGAPPPGTPTALPTLAEPPASAAPSSQQAELLARVGKGKIRDAHYTSDGKIILVAFETGLGTFDAVTLGEVAFWDLPEKALRLALLAEKEVAVFTAEGNIQFVGFDPTSATFSASTRTPLTTDVIIRNEAEDPCLLAASPNGQFLGISTRESTQVWNLSSGKPILSNGHNASFPYQLSFSADSQYLLLSDDKLASFSTDNFLITLVDGKVIWNQKGKALLSGGNKLMFWNTPEKYSLAPLSSPTSTEFIKFVVTDGQMIFSPDGALGVIYIWNTGIWLFKTESGQIINNYEATPPHLDYTEAPVYLSNTGMLVTYKSRQEAATPGPGGKPIKFIYTPFVQDMKKGQFGQEITPPFEILYPLPQVYFAPDGGSFLYTDRSSLVRLEPTTQKITSFTDQLTSGVTALAFAPDGKTLAAGLQYFSVDYFDAAQGLMRTRSEPLQTAEGVSYRYPGASPWYSGVTGLEFFSNGRQLAADSSNGALYLLTPDGSQPPFEISLNADVTGKGGVVEMFGLAIAPGGEMIATGGYENAVRLWSGLPRLAALPKDNGAALNISHTAGVVKHSLLDDSSVVTFVAYSPDGKLLAAGTEKGYIRLWRTDGVLERTLKGHTGRVTGLAFAGKTLVSVAEDGSARFWNLGDGSQTHLLNLGEPGESLALDARGEVLALGMESGKTYLWDLKNGRWLGSLPGVGVVRALAFSPDAARLAIGSESGQIQLWQVRLADGQVAQFPAGEPQTVVANPAACKFTQQVKDFSEGTFVAGSAARLEWTTYYNGDCSSLDEKSLREVENTPGLAAKYSLTSEFNISPRMNRLHIYADVTVPATPGTYHYTWELATPTGEPFPFSASLTVLEAPAGLNLPAPLYFVSESGALLRLETDARTLTSIIEAPVICMDISPSSGEIAYLSDDALWLADLNGGNRRVLLPIGGCPSWSPDGTLIGFTLNGVKVLKVASGEIQNLAADLHAFGTQARYFRRVLDWSPFSNKFVASVSGWEYFGLRVFDLPTGDESGITGFSNPAWSLNGEYVYTGEYEYSAYYGSPPYLIRNNILTGEPETLLGNSESDLSGGFAPFETTDGRLLAFIGRLSSPDSPPGALAAAQMRLDAPGQFTYDPNPHPILSPAEVLWWRDGSLAIVKLKGGEVLATFPFSQNPNLYLPVRGTDLRWNTFAPKVASAPVPTATLPSAASSSTSSELGRYTLAFIGGAVSNAPQINTIHADGSGLLRPYPTLPSSTSLTQFAWAADGQSLFALDGTQFYQVRKLDSQFFEFALPAGLPGYVTLNGGQIKDFSISPNGRYLAIVYTPMDASIFDLPHAEQRVERDNLGLLDLQQKRWIDVDIPAISSSYAGKAAILFSASAWSKDSQQFVVTVTQYPGETLQKTSNGFALASFHTGGSGSDIVGLVVADVRGKARNITLASNAVDDVTAEFLPFWAQDGQIYFFSTDEAGNPGLYRIAPSGKSQTRITDCEGMDITTPAFAVSPDGRNLAARTLFPDDGSMRLAIINTNSGKKTFLPPEASPLETPVWSPDGKQLAWFGLDESSTPKIFLLNADGSHLTPLSLPSSVTEAQRLTWSPDGIWLAFRSYLQAGGIGLYITRADGADTRLVSSDLLEMGAPQWSPVVITH